jgi:hypothetical protein
MSLEEPADPDAERAWLDEIERGSAELKKDKATGIPLGRYLRKRVPRFVDARLSSSGRARIYHRRQALRNSRPRLGRKLHSAGRARPAKLLPILRLASYSRALRSGGALFRDFPSASI